jgi:acid phosphatase family membrane protein YuiD
VLENSDSIVAQLGRNRIFVASISSWFTAQVLKVVLGVLKDRRFNFKWLISSGGMPSSHVAVSACLTASIGLYYGFDSGLFAMALCFAAITMFDAQGVRWHSGKQAQALNRILEDIYSNKGIQEAPLKQLIGHTPIEVYAGMALGIVMAVLFYRNVP